MILTKDFLKTMRLCTTVVLRHSNGRDVIECVFEDKDHKELKRETFTIIEEKLYNNRPDYAVTSFCVAYNRQFLTIVAMLKAGDAIKLYWHKDCHTNQYMEKNGLHGDSLILKVFRGKKYFEFELCSSVCEQNTARMIDPDKCAYR